eukprot:jgi/Chlat1/7303/Chrsp58S09140
MLIAFPQLREPGLVVLEVGCGSGCTLLPIIKSNPTAKLYACDVSQAAVTHTRAAVMELGADAASRVACFVWDPATQPFPVHAAGVGVNVSDCAGHLTHVLLVFTLSAVAPQLVKQLLTALKGLLRPGGYVLLRDYGLYDMTMLRFEGSQRLFENLYMRSDGTLARFFSLDDARDMFVSVGFDCLELKYCWKLQETMMVALLSTMGI